MRKYLIVLMCCAILSSCSANTDTSSDTTSEVSDTLTSTEASEPVSSETATSELTPSEPATNVPAPSKPATTSTVNTNTSSKTNQDQEAAEVEKQVEVNRKINGEKIDSYVSFIVVDTDGNPIDDVKTSFQSGVPNTSESADFVNFNSNATTDKSGKTSVQLIRQFDYLGIESIQLSWDRPYYATISRPDGKQDILKNSQDGKINVECYIDTKKNKNPTFKIVLEAYDAAAAEGEKRNSEKINSYVNFTVVDSDGNPVESVKTSFESGIPNTTQGSYLVDFNSNATTDKSGKTSVELIRQFTDLGIWGLQLTLDKPYSATITTPDGKETKAPASSNINIPCQIFVDDNHNYNIKVVLDK